MAKRYDLEERTFRFAAAVRAFVKGLPDGLANTEDSRQVVRSSGSMGANYIEANESLGKKDFLYHVRIARKESKETRYWLGLLETGGDKDLERKRSILVRESTELMNIFGAILRNSQRGDSQ